MARIQSNSTAGSGLTVLANSRVGIGIATPSAALEVSGTLKFAGATTVVSGGVLTSDASGNATWRAPAAATSSIALSSITSATATNTIDSTNFAQTWGWSTLSTQNALTISASALTTGSLLNLTTPNASVSSTNGLLYVANTSAGTNGVVARIQSNSTAGSGLTVFANGNISVGLATAPRSTLDVSGTLLVKPSTLNGTATIDFLTGNLQHTAASCGAFILHNMKDGGSYTFAVKGATSATCSFTAFSDAGVTGLTVHMPSDHAATTAAKHTLYSFLVMGTDVYITWLPDL